MRGTACLFAATLAAAGTVAFAGGSSVPTVTVALPSSDAAVPFEVGLRHGIFTAAGVQVKVMTVGSTADAIAAVVAGQAQFGVGDPASVMVYATNKPAALQLVSGVTATKRGSTGLLTSSSSGIKTATDTYGKRIGVPELGGLDRLATQIWLDANGGDTNSNTFVQVAPANARRALAKGYADVVLVEQPEVSELATVPGIRSLGDIENGLFGSSAPSTAVFSTMKFLRSSTGNPMAVRFVRALGTAISYADTHPSQMATLLASTAGWPAVTAATAPPQYSATIDTFILEQLAESLYAYGLTGSVQPNVADLTWVRAPQSS